MNCRLKNIFFVTLLFFFNTYIEAQNSSEQFIIPKTAKFAVIGNEGGQRHVFCTHPSGSVFWFNDGIVQSFEDDITYSIPNKIKPTSMFFTNDGTLIFYSGDTIYSLDTESRIKALMGLNTKQLIVHPIGFSDFVFCEKGKNTIRRYFSKKGRIEDVVFFNHPIGDFAVDNEDLFIAYGDRVAVYSKDSRYFPILEEELPITNLAICSKGSLIYSTALGLWYIGVNRHKYKILEKNIEKIITDYNDRAFVELKDGTWIIIRPVSEFDKLDSISNDKNIDTNSNIKSKELKPSFFECGNENMNVAEHLYQTTVVFENSSECKNMTSTEWNWSQDTSGDKDGVSPVFLNGKAVYPIAKNRSINVSPLDKSSGNTIDVFLYGLTRMQAPLLSDISVSRNRTLVLATENALVGIGYDDAAAMNVEDKRISTFCTVGDTVYFADGQKLYIVDSLGNVKLLTELPFKPIRLWSGEKDIYTAGYEDGKNYVYVVSTGKGRLTKFYSTDEPVVGIDEMGCLIYVLTDRHLTVVNIPKRKYASVTLNRAVLGDPRSLAIDRMRGAIYISSDKGVFRAYYGELEKVCGCKGAVCYDEDGLLIFDSEAPGVIRLRNNMLWESDRPKPVVVKTR